MGYNAFTIRFEELEKMGSNGGWKIVGISFRILVNGAEWVVFIGSKTRYRMTFVLIGGFHVSYVDGFINFFPSNFISFSLQFQSQSESLQQEAALGGHNGRGRG